MRYLHITFEFAQVVVGFLTHDGAVETFWFELYPLCERGRHKVIIVIIFDTRRLLRGI